MRLSCTDAGDWVLDPFSGSSTTGIAANLCGRRFCGLEQEEESCQMSKLRREQLSEPQNDKKWRGHLSDLCVLSKMGQYIESQLTEQSECFLSPF